MSEMFVFGIKGELLKPRICFLHLSKHTREIHFYTKPKQIFNIFYQKGSEDRNQDKVKQNEAENSAAR